MNFGYGSGSGGYFILDHLQLLQDLVHFPVMKQSYTNTCLHTTIVVSGTVHNLRFWIPTLQDLDYGWLKEHTLHLHRLRGLEFFLWIAHTRKITPSLGGCYL